jgi:hypothetical protein
MGTNSDTTAKPVLTFGEGDFTISDLLSYTFSNLNIGTANTNRRVIVGIAVRRNATISPAYPTVTVAGQSCTRIIGELSSTGTSSAIRVGMAVYITDAAVTSGSTANVVVAYSSGPTMTRCFASTYSIVKNGTLVQESALSGSSNPTITSTKTSNMVGVAVSGSGTTGTISAPTITGPVSVDYASGIQEAGAYISATVTGAGDIEFDAYGTGATSRAAVVLWS